MFKLNAIQRTKSGERVMPFDVNGDVVSCFTKNKEVVYRLLKDFDFSPKPKSKKVITVNSVEEKTTDQLFTPQEDNSVAEDVIEPPQPESQTNPDSDSDPDPDPEPDGGSIWNDIDDDNYI